MPPRDPSLRRSPLVLWAGVLGVAQLVLLVVSPTVSDPARSEEWVFDVAYLVAVVLALTGWAALVVVLLEAVRGGRPRNRRTPALAPRLAVASATAAVGLLLALVVLVVVLDVGRSGAWLPVLTQGLIALLLLALALAHHRRSR